MPSGHLKRRFHREIESEFLQAFHEMALESVFMDLLQVIASGFVVADHEHRMSDRHQGPLGASPSSYTLELRREVAILFRLTAQAA